jgi:hypothetical protein
MTSAKKPMGAYWKESKFSETHQLYRRIETVASQLEQRNWNGWRPLKKHIIELRDISYEVRDLPLRRTKSSTRAATVEVEN